MLFFKVTDDITGKTQGVFRFERSDEDIVCDRYDIGTKEWVDHPPLIKIFVGLGRNNDFIPIKEDEAMAFY